MKKILVITLLLTCFLFITPQVSANNSNNDHNDDKHDVFHDSRDRFNTWWGKFRHKNDKHQSGRGDHDGENDETDLCYDGDYTNDEGCVYPVTSAPEFGGMTAPIAFMGSAIAFVIGKQRGLI